MASHEFRRAATGSTKLEVIPVLMYHQVSPTPIPVKPKYSVHPDQFRAQLDCLVEMGCTVVSLDDVIAKNVLPDRPVVITFDDGFRDLSKHAFPALIARKMPATFYIVAGRTGASSIWTKRYWNAEIPLMNWSQIGELHDAGCDCESHSLTHSHLSLLSKQQCLEEMLRSKQTIEEKLTKEVRHFSYPFGDVNPAVRACAVEAGYSSACITTDTVATSDSDVFLIPRLTVDGTAPIEVFARRLRHIYSPRNGFRSHMPKWFHRIGRAGA